MKNFNYLLLAILFYNSPTYSQWEWLNPTISPNELNEVYFVNDSIGWSVGYYGTILKTTDAGSNWLQATKSLNNNFFCVFFINQDTGWVGGSDGIILKTTDGGINWIEQYSKPEYDIRSIYCIDANICFAAGGRNQGVNQYSITLKTTNGGVDWVSLPNYGYYLYSTFFVNADTGFTVGGDWPIGTISKTADGGISWYEPTVGSIYVLRSLSFVNNQIGYAVGWGGEVIKTFDGGENWFKAPYNLHENLFDVVFYNEDIGYAAIWGGILKTIDGGVNWNFLAVDEYKRLNSVELLNKDTLFTAGVRGLMYRSYDGGNSMIRLSGFTDNFNSVSLISPELYWAAGDSGKIIKTVDGGISWISTNTNTNNNLNSIMFIDETTGFAVGENGLILKSTNGGINWTSMQSNTIDDLYNIFLLDNYGWVVGYNGTILKSTDWGLTWKVKLNGLYYPFRSVYFQNNQVGWVVGGYIGMMGKTIDGGDNWELTQVDNYQVDIQFTNDSVGWMISYNNIYKTIDSGINWNKKNNFSDPRSSFLDLCFADSLYGWIVGSNGLVINTINGGASWGIQRFDPTYRYPPNHFNSISMVDTNFGVVVGDNGSILKTFNGGYQDYPHPEIPELIYPINNSVNLETVYFEFSFQKTCIYQLQVSTSKSFSDTLFDGLFFYNSTHIFYTPFSNSTDYYWKVRTQNQLGISNWSDIWKFTTGTLVSIDDENNRVLDYFLHQNYPNPFNPSTTIRFQIPEPAKVTIKVYDVLGREITTLLDEEKKAGKYEFFFDAHSFASGIYFYRIQTGSFVKTNKMILLK